MSALVHTNDRETKSGFKKFSNVLFISRSRDCYAYFQRKFWQKLPLKICITIKSVEFIHPPNNPPSPLIHLEKKIMQFGIYIFQHIYWFWFSPKIFKYYYIIINISDFFSNPPSFLYLLIYLWGLEIYFNLIVWHEWLYLFYQSSLIRIIWFFYEYIRKHTCITKLLFIT